MKSTSIIACHECDLLQRIKPLPVGGIAQCVRCGAVLCRRKKNSIDRTLALTLTGLILFVLANAYPFLAMKSEGLVQETTLISGVRELYAEGMVAVAALVFFTSILAPFAQILGLLYVLVPLKIRRLPRNLPWVFRFVQGLRPWGMMEVFMLGILVSIVKLAKTAEIVPGIALYSFLVLIFVLAASAVSLDPHLIWQKWEQGK